MSGRPWMIVALWVAVQTAVPLWRMDVHNAAPFSSRFSWSMFAGRPIARCSHRIEYTTQTGTSVPFPLPPLGHPARRVLEAQTPDEFTKIVPLLTVYADRDEVLFEMLEDLLRRHKRVIDPRHTHILISTLNCRAYNQRVFVHTIRLSGP
jgi:hypothetical protein